MWKLFKKYIWDSVLGKVLTGIGTLSTIYSLILIFVPDIYNNISDSIQVDKRIWYGVSPLFLIAIIIYLLFRFNKDIKSGESKDNIRIVYNERYLPCRQVESDTEIIRVGLRIKGSNTNISSPIVILSSIINLEERKPIPVLTLPLLPFVEMDIVHRGFTPEYWVNIFKHRIGEPYIEICYDRIEPQKIKLSEGKYQLHLIARGIPCSNHVSYLTITMNNRNELNIELGKEG